MSRKRRVNKKHKRIRISLKLIILGVIVAGVVLYLRPLPPVYPLTSPHVAITGSNPVLSWPASSEAAVGALNFGVLETNNPQKPLPTASTAKLITALTVLSRYPLTATYQGPEITISQNDVDIYNSYLNENGSVAKVALGEQLSEYQALEAMLIPSANNIADTLAIWAYGSLGAYQQAATKLVSTLGLSDTTIGTDASGFLPTTVSTAHDLVVLGQDAMQNSIIAQIVAQKQVTLPVAGVVNNVNALLGEYGIVGIKTGNTDQAGGVYVFAAVDNVTNVQPITVVGAIMGAPTLNAAVNDALPLLFSTEHSFSDKTVIQKGQVVGSYKTPWGETDNAIATEDIKTVTWANVSFNPIVSLHAIYAPLKSGTTVGSVGLTTSTAKPVPVVLQSNLSSAQWWWRIFR